MENEDFNFEKEYKELQDKYKLPNFDSLAEDFDTEKIFEKESSFIIREIRRALNEKLYSYSNLFENLINPTNIPMSILNAIRHLSLDEKKKIREIYKDLSKRQIEVIKLDTIYNEKSEAEFVCDTYKLWQKLKPEIYKIIETLEEKTGENNNFKESAYFG